jgi:hypothetical protein
VTPSMSTAVRSYKLSIAPEPFKQCGIDRADGVWLIAGCRDHRVAVGMSALGQFLHFGGVCGMSATAWIATELARAISDALGQDWKSATLLDHVVGAAE